MSELFVNFPEVEAEVEQRQAEAKGLELIVTANEEMFLNGTPFPADHNNLRLILVVKAGARRDIPISIIADADTRHAMVVMSMDTESKLGFKQLSISTQKPLASN